MAASEKEAGSRGKKVGEGMASGADGTKEGAVWRFYDISDCAF
jgi:hypothetical protein